MAGHNKMFTSGSLPHNPWMYSVPKTPPTSLWGSLSTSP